LKAQRVDGNGCSFSGCRDMAHGYRESTRAARMEGTKPAAPRLRLGLPSGPHRAPGREGHVPRCAERRGPCPTRPGARGAPPEPDRADRVTAMRTVSGDRARATREPGYDPGVTVDYRSRRRCVATMLSIRRETTGVGGSAMLVWSNAIGQSASANASMNWAS